MELGLENVNPIQMRIEKMDREVHFATIISRAFSDLDHMLKMIGPLMDNKTQLLAMKGQVPEGELENLKRENANLKLKMGHLKNQSPVKLKSIHWFLAGAGVLLFGFVIGRSARREKRTSIYR